MSLKDRVETIVGSLDNAGLATQVAGLAALALCAGTVGYALSRAMTPVDTPVDRDKQALDAKRRAEILKFMHTNKPGVGMRIARPTDEVPGGVAIGAAAVAKGEGRPIVMGSDGITGYGAIYPYDPDANVKRDGRDLFRHYESLDEANEEIDVYDKAGGIDGLLKLSQNLRALHKSEARRAVVNQRRAETGTNYVVDEKIERARKRIDAAHQSSLLDDDLMRLAAERALVGR